MLPWAFHSSQKGRLSREGPLRSKTETRTFSFWVHPWAVAKSDGSSFPPIYPYALLTSDSACYIVHTVLYSLRGSPNSLSVFSTVLLSAPAIPFYMHLARPFFSPGTWFVDPRIPRQSQHAPSWRTELCIAVDAAWDVVIFLAMDFIVCVHPSRTFFFLYTTPSTTQLPLTIMPFIGPHLSPSFAFVAF